MSHERSILGRQSVTRNLEHLYSSENGPSTCCMPRMESSSKDPARMSGVLERHAHATVGCHEEILLLLSVVHARFSLSSGKTPYSASQISSGDAGNNRDCVLRRTVRRTVCYVHYLSWLLLTCMQRLCSPVHPAPDFHWMCARREAEPWVDNRCFGHGLGPDRYSL